MRNVGEITFDFESTEEKAEECTRAALAELPKIREADYFADDEMRGAARLIEVDEAGQRETTDGYAHLLTYEWAMASLDYYATYQDRVRAVTRADVARYLDTYVLGKPFVFGVVESPKLATAMSRARLEGLAGIGAAPAKKGGKP
jgi:zinc protease